MEENKKSISFVETPKEISDFMASLITKDRSISILDAGCGKGAFLEVLKNREFKRVSGIELDSSFVRYCKKRFPEYEIVNNDFLKLPNKEQYDVIIGNPPYVHFNSLPDFARENVYNLVGSKESDIYYAFIIKAVELLKPGGELIFITPYSFNYNTFAYKVRSYLSLLGRIELIIDLDEARLFSGENPETCIFKFVKGGKLKKMHVLKLKNKNASPDIIRDSASSALQDKKSNSIFDYFSREPFRVSEGIWSFYPKVSLKSYNLLKHLARVCVGFVSGFDKAFLLNDDELKKLNKKELSLVKPFVKAKHCKGSAVEGKSFYIFTDDIKDEEELKKYPNVFKKLSEYKNEMMNRYLPNGRKWFHWQAVRNGKIVEENINNPKIFVPCLDRSKENRFSLTIEPVYPAGDVLVIFPKPGYESFMLEYLNSNQFRNYYLSNGGRRGGRMVFTQRLLSDSQIPVFIKA